METSRETACRKPALIMNPPGTYPRPSSVIGSSGEGLVLLLTFEAAPFRRQRPSDRRRRAMGTLSLMVRNSSRCAHTYPLASQ